MIAFPNAKINIGLYVKGERADGYHDIETIFYPVALCDVLEILPEKNHKTPSFRSSGISIPGDPATNLCLKAYGLLKADFDLPPVKMFLHKNIPAGAGLAGGSSNATATLLLLNVLFDLKLSDEQLAIYALMLGSDCPFFLRNGPMRGEGRGELLRPVLLDLTDFYIALINPGIHVNTAAAFAGLKQNEYSGKALMGAIESDPGGWREQIRNDFEESVFAQHPEIGRLKELFYGAGAIYASMSGTGSTVYGLFPKSAGPPVLRVPAHYFCRLI